jgi:hypothetical protein
LFLGRFCQNLAILGSFGQFWIDSAAMVVADNMPTFERKNKTSSLLQKVSKSCWKGLLNFPSTKKFQKFQLQIKFVNACPKSLNSICGIHTPLGVK